MDEGLAPALVLRALEWLEPCCCVLYRNIIPARDHPIVSSVPEVSIVKVPSASLDLR